MLIVRSLEASDVPAATRLSTHPEVASRVGGTPFDGEELWSRHLSERDLARSLALGAFEDGELVGLISLTGLAAVRQQHVGRIAIAVDAAHHRKGVGSRLLAAVTESADLWLGMIRVELGVQERNTAAIALYKKHGFVIEAYRRADMLVDGEPAPGLWMARLRPGFVAPPELGAPPPIPPRATRLPVTVRARRASDASELARIHQTASVMEGTCQLPYQPVAAWEKRFESAPPGAHVLVAEMGGVIVGACGLFPLGRNPRMRHVAAVGMAVDPSAQGCGVGHALVGALTELADGFLGLKRVELEVYVDNERARTLYEHHGFEIEGRLAAHAFRRGTYVDSFLMARIPSLPECSSGGTARERARPADGRRRRPSRPNRS